MADSPEESKVAILAGNGTRKPPPLHRNQACAQCKRKKRKCDAIKPFCSPCLNSAKLYQEDPKCDWGPSGSAEGTPLPAAAGAGFSTEQSPVSAGTSTPPQVPHLQPVERPTKQLKRGRAGDRSSSLSHVESLQARIAELESALEAAQPTGTYNHSAVPSSVFPTPPLTVGSSTFSSPVSAEHATLDGNRTVIDFKALRASTASVPQAESAGQPSQLGQGLFQDVLWPAWPKDLPHLNVVKMLTQPALALISTTMFILPPDALFHSLALPPTDPRFPSLGLLHALCALGASMVPLPSTCQDYWRDAPTPSAYHFRRAKVHINQFSYNSVLDDARAALLLTVYSFAAEQFMEVWQLVGMACRSLAPAGLNHVQNHCAIPSNKMAVSPGHFLRKPTFLGAPVDDLDVFYRTTTLWQAYSCDVWMGACSGWSPALSVEDVTSLLPVWPSETTPLDVVLSQPGLDPHSDLFFISHLDSPVLSLHLSIKAMCLLGRVTNFLQRSTLPGATIDLDTKDKIRNSTAFVNLVNTVVDFQRHIPENARHPVVALSNGRLDANLLNAHIVPTVGILLLFEPFIFGSDSDPGFQRSLLAANSVLSITEAIYAHSQDQIVMYYTQINYCWMVCNRTYIRAMRFREEVGDFEGAAAYRRNIEFLLARITPLSSRSPLVGSCLNMLTGLINDEGDWYKQ